MRVLHVNTNAYFGGAAIAARRHCEAMRKQGIDAMMLSLVGDEDGMTKLFVTKPHSYIHSKFIWILHRIRSKILFRSPWHFVEKDFNICSLNIVRDADIIYLHWVNDFLGYKAVENLLKTGKPIVWFLHDMWPITGGCHYSFACKGYEEECLNCPELNFFKFLAHRQHNMKYKKWNGYENLILAAPSKWLTDSIKQSSLFRQNKVFTIRNVVDTDTFCPSDKLEIRKTLRLPLNKRLVIFSAIGTNNPYKGLEYLIKALVKLKDNDYEYIVIGECNNQIFPDDIRDKMHFVGYVSSQKEMINLYNSADALLTTSLADNFPNVVIEAMACGLPVVGFTTGGIVEQIRHKINGWAVEPKDVDGVATGINWLFNEADYSTISENARKYVIEECSYHNVLNNHQMVFCLINEGIKIC